MKLYTAKSVAYILNITERRVRQLKDENVINEYESCTGLYDLVPTLHKYIEYLRRHNPENGENIDYNAERAKLVRAKRLNEEYDIQLKEKQLHTSGDIEKIMTDMLTNFKSRLLSIPSKLSPMLSKKTDKAEIYKLIKEQIDEALNELSDYQTAFANQSNKREAQADEDADGGII